MVSPSQLEAARKVPDRQARTRKMAEIMREGAASNEACRVQDLRAAGFTEAEIFAYADDARAILSCRPNAGRRKTSPARKEGLALVRQAQHIRQRIKGQS